ncbi:hypothetical protein CEY12_11440 [Chryseobacterium sp. T16E-39]|uniref:hypothetical protein n=1 Tax=Chryseobacterium sp. T16E-39 TaxID=2015076 RepID=UPI000B5B29EC|nr:hypothetical protein [Chryseobacterium sp. T16E-39]ASK30690.1 hypothetical protein CEY12_11440 [Chryseobacterium sp. T16E-39]
MEPTNIDFKNIWQKQKVNQPDIKDLLNKLKQFKSKNLRKLIIANILLTLTGVFIILIWLHYLPEFVSTKIGIVLILLAMTVYLFAYNKMFALFYKTDDTQPSTEYLKNLYLIKNRQRFMETRMINTYFIMLTTGICLYMYEYASRMSITMAIVTYSITLLWIGFNWFYVRPRTIKKQQTKLNELIKKFEDISQQLKE